MSFYRGKRSFVKKNTQIHKKKCVAYAASLNLCFIKNKNKLCNSQSCGAKTVSLVLLCHPHTITLGHFDAAFAKFVKTVLSKKFSVIYIENNTNKRFHVQTLYGVWLYG